MMTETAPSAGTRSSIFRSGGTTFPAAHEIFLYHRKGVLLVVPMQWKRAGASQARFRPRIDFEASWAKFESGAAGRLEFRLAELPDTSQGLPQAVIRTILTPKQAQALDLLVLPSEGIPGEIFVRTAVDVVRTPARLIPWYEPPLFVDCQVPANQVYDPKTGALKTHIWRVHEVGPSIEVPLSFSSLIPLWLLRVGPNEEESGTSIRLSDIKFPALIDPASPLSCKLIVDNRTWEPNRTFKFAFKLTFANYGGAVVFQGRVGRAEGATLHFSGGKSMRLDLVLGKTEELRVTLSAEDGPAKRSRRSSSPTASCNVRRRNGDGCG